MSNKFLRWLNLITFLMAVVVNGLANALPINHNTTAEVSNSYPVLFTPAGYVFSIWGLIYLSLLGFSIFQLIPSQRFNPEIDKIGGWFIASNLLNAAWIFSWHYRIISVSILLMAALLVTLSIIYKEIGIGKTHIGTQSSAFIHFPFSLYLGWISIAFIANFSVFLYSIHWNGFGLSPVFWTVFVVVFAAGLGIFMLRSRHDITFVLVLLWACVGIQFKNGVNPTVGTAAGIASASLIFYLVFTLLRIRQANLISNRSNRHTF